MKGKLLNAIGLVLLVTGFGCSGSRARIDGLLAGGEGESLKLEKLNVNQTSVVDSIKVGPDGTFSLKIETDEPELYLLKNSKGDIINLLVSPGDQISITTSQDSFGHGYRVEGSGESEVILKIKLAGVSPRKGTRPLNSS